MATCPSCSTVTNPTLFTVATVVSLVDQAASPVTSRETPFASMLREH
jgi:hypothetical protein